jgi:type 1 glutamine amidotransferase
MKTVLAAFVLALAFTSTTFAAEPIRALLVTGGCCHDYDNQKKILSEGISARANVVWTIVHEGGKSTDHKVSIYSDPKWADKFDIVVHDECFAGVKDKDFVDGILKPHLAGKPGVNLHCAMHCYRVDFDKYRDWFNFVGVDSRAHGPQEPIAITFTDSSHPITKGLSNWTTIKEELYNNINLVPTSHELARGKQQYVDKKSKKDVTVDWMVAWTNEFGPNKTKVFSTTLGHNNETVADPKYLDLVTRGLLWATGHLTADGAPATGYGPNGK